MGLPPTTRTVVALQAALAGAVLGCAELAGADAWPDDPQAAGSGAASSTSSGVTGGAAAAGGSSGGAGAASPLADAVAWSGACAWMTAQDAEPLNFPDSPFTLELWFSPHQLPMFQVLVAHGGTASITPGWSLYTEGPSLRLYTFDDTGSNTSVLSSVMLETDARYHVAVVREGGNAQLWVRNATQEQTVHAPAAGRTAVMPSWGASFSQPFTIAGLFNGSGCATDLFGGVIDDVRVWSVARTERQINEAADEPLPCGSENLVAYWTADGVSGNELPHCNAARAGLDLVITGRGYEFVPSPF